MVLDKTPESPWTARRSNQSILKEINPAYSLVGLMLNLKLQCFGHLMQRDNSMEKTLMLEKILRAKGEGGDRGWDSWMASLTQWTWVWANSGRWWRTEKPGLLQFMGSQRVRHHLEAEQQLNNKPRDEASERKPSCQYLDLTLLNLQKCEREV